MFTWICPQCGREVLPSYTECPHCSPKPAAGTPAPPAAAGPPAPGAPPQGPAGAPPPAYQQPVYQQAPPQQPVYQQPVYQQPPEPPAYQPPPQQPVYQPPPQPMYQQLPQQPVYQQPPQPPAQAPQPIYAPQYAPGSGGMFSGMPTWLLTIIFAAVIIGLVGGVYWLVGSSHGGTQASAQPPATVENPAAKAGAKQNPIQKYVEVSGIRFTEDDRKRLMVKFTVTNHSDSDLSGLTGNVTIWARTQKSEEDNVGTFAFTANVGPEASQEVTAPLTTKLKIYELPDWQNVTTDLQITAPQ